jgi:hypothetical protein
VLGSLSGCLLVRGSGSPFAVAVDVLASLWLLTTVIAHVIATRRQIVQHRQWMIRSYAPTFFVVDRVRFEFSSFSSEPGDECLPDLDAVHPRDSHSGHRLHVA